METPVEDSQNHSQEAPVASFPRIITIDGPAASGKSTVGHALAQQLDYLFFDTGILYRAVTWAMLARGIDPDDSLAVGELAASLPVQIKPPAAQNDGRQATVQVGEQDVTWAIRSPAVDQNVSKVAAKPRVRQALTRQQRRIGHRYGQGNAEKPGIVMVGRDIGTVVLPDAPLKIYLDAPVAVRARRRYDELVQRGKEDVRFDQVLADMRRRDRIDSQRQIAPLRPADDAHVLDTSHLSPQAIVVQIIELAQQLQKSKR